MRDILPDVTRWLEDGQTVALATVIQTWGSSPRSEGARMAFTSDNKITGSVSGGCVEGAVIQAGMEVLKTGVPQLLHFSVADETAWQVGLACGGTLEVFVKPLDESIFHSMRASLGKPQAFAHVMIVRGIADLLGREFIFSPKGKILGNLDQELEQEIFDLSLRSLDEKRSGRYTLKTSIEPIEIFVDTMLRTPTLVMVGGVQIAQALTAIATTLGYRTIIIDPRKAFGNVDRFSHAGQIIQSWPEDAFSKIEINDDTAICMLTHDPKIDDPALRIALNSPAFYVGALGSRSTQAKRRQRMLEAGLAEVQLARLHAPIGLDINAETPEEIALSIMAEVVAVRQEQKKALQETLIAALKDNEANL